MRRSLAVVLTACSLAFAGAAGLAAPVALAAGSASTTASTAATTSTPAVSSSSSSGFGLSNAEANATSQSDTTAANNTATVASSSSTGGISGFDAILIGVIVALVLIGISFWVWWDARSNVARLRHGGGSAAEPMFARAHAGSKTPRKVRKPKPAERKRRKRGRAR
jgi:hypothetical protein